MFDFLESTSSRIKSLVYFFCGGANWEESGSILCPEGGTSLDASAFGRYPASNARAGAYRARPSQRQQVSNIRQAQIHDESPAHGIGRSSTYWSMMMVSSIKLDSRATAERNSNAWHVSVAAYPQLSASVRPLTSTPRGSPPPIRGPSAASTDSTNRVLGSGAKLAG